MTEQFPELNPQELNSRTSNLEVLNNLVKPEVLTDQENFLRTRFNVIDPHNPNDSLIAVEFRGREELPITSRTDQEMHVVLSEDVRPFHTGMDRFGKWTETISDSQGNNGVVLSEPTLNNVQSRSEKIWATASKKGAEKVVLHAPGTPEGVIDVAIQLVASGIGTPDAIGKLIKLRSELSSKKYSDDCLDLMNTLFAVCSDIADPDVTEPSHEGGLMLMALSLTGREDAIEAVHRAEKSFKLKKLAEDLGSRSTRDYYTGEVISLPSRITEAGKPVDVETIEAVKEAGLVTVHTTQTRPIGDKILRSTAEFNKDDNKQIPRDSIHFSLNHAVTNNMGGNFSDRTFTIVSPLSGMLEANGAPAAMADVDTYFMGRPGEGIILPEDTTIIELASMPEGSAKIVQQDGSWRINNEQLKSLDGLRQIATEIQELSGEPTSGYTAIDPLISLAGKLTFYGGLDIDIEHLQAERNKPGEYYFEQLTPEKREQTLAHSADIQSIYEIFKSDQFGMTAILNNPQLLESNGSLNRLLSESIRKVLVATAIKKLGGEVVKGGAHNTESKEFEDLATQLADRVGVTSGLHANLPEAHIETAYYEALRNAQEFVQEPDGKNIVADFNWTKYSSDSLWSWLSKSSSQIRTRAMQMGILTYGKKAPTRPTASIKRSSS